VKWLYLGNREPFGIEHMFIYTSLLRMTGTMTSQIIDLSSLDILYYIAVQYGHNMTLGWEFEVAVGNSHKYQSLLATCFCCNVEWSHLSDSLSFM
jgi:hypothetical protein